MATRALLRMVVSRNAVASPVPVGEIEALLDHLDELGATVQRHLRRGAKSYIPFILQGLQYSASAL